MVHTSEGITTSSVPDGQAERNLVDEVSNVVGEVAWRVTPLVEKVSEEVSQWVDGPSDGDNQSHGVVGGLDEWVHLVSLGCGLASFTEEDFEEDESPSSHTEPESQPWVHVSGFTEVSECQHSNSSDHQSPEHSTGDVWVDGREDQVELDHLKRDGDGPIDVTVDDRRLLELDPVFTHVEVVHSGDEGDQGTDVKRGLPVGLERQGFHEEEDGGCDHGNGDDPEGDGNWVVGVQESSSVDVSSLDLVAFRDGSCKNVVTLVNVLGVLRERNVHWGDGRNVSGVLVGDIQLEVYFTLADRLVLGVVDVLCFGHSWSILYII